MKTKKKSGKTLRKSGKSQGKIREFDGIKKVGTLGSEPSGSGKLKCFCSEDLRIYIWSRQGSYSDWKIWENGKTSSSQGKVKEF